MRPLVKRLRVTYMKTYYFRTKKNNRVEVIASSPRSAYNKLMSIPMFKHDLTTSFSWYDSDGTSPADRWHDLNHL